LFAGVWGILSATVISTAAWMNNLNGPAYEAYIEKREADRLRETFGVLALFAISAMNNVDVARVCRERITGISGWRLHYCVPSDSTNATQGCLCYSISQAIDGVGTYTPLQINSRVGCSSENGVFKSQPNESAPSNWQSAAKTPLAGLDY
jgi:hypothetical protein